MKMNRGVPRPAEAAVAASREASSEVTPPATPARRKSRRVIEQPPTGIYPWESAFVDDSRPSRRATPTPRRPRRSLPGHPHGHAHPVDSVHVRDEEGVDRQVEAADERGPAGGGDQVGRLL